MTRNKSVESIRSLSKLVLLFGLCAGFSLLAVAQEARGFAGTWLRNPTDSDDPKDKTRAAAEEIFDKATKGGRGMFTEDIQQIQKDLQVSLASFVQFADTLIIEDKGKELLVDDGLGRIRIFYLDGKKHARQSPGGVKFETLSTRRGSQIIVDQKMKNARIIETYALSDQGNRLVLSVNLETKRLKEPLRLRNVYDREM